MATKKTETVSDQQKIVDRSKEKASKFVELAQKRVSKALGAIRQIENLSNTASYNYTDDQVAKIVSALATAVKKVSEKFAAKPAAAKSAPEFTL